jgi:hypothetical protein
MEQWRAGGTAKSYAKRCDGWVPARRVGTRETAPSENVGRPSTDITGQLSGIQGSRSAMLPSKAKMLGSTEVFKNRTDPSPIPKLAPPE